MEQGGRDPTIMYLLRALKYQLLSSSKMEESMQQYSHKYEVLHSGKKPFKNEKKKQILATTFSKIEISDQAVLPDLSVIIGHSNATFRGIFKQCALG